MSRAIYLKTDDNSFIYRVKYSRTNVYNDDIINSSIYWDLTLVAGRDYIAPDYSDRQGWVTADAFVEDAQWEQIIQYPFSESFKELAEEEGYEIIEEDDLPPIYQASVYPYQYANVKEN